MMAGSFPPFPRRVAVVGSTGSIGEKALAVVAQYPERFQVKSLAAGHASARLAEQASRFEVECIAVATAPEGVTPLGSHLRTGPERVAEGPDQVVGASTARGASAQPVRADAAERVCIVHHEPGMVVVRQTVEVRERR